MKPKPLASLNHFTVPVETLLIDAFLTDLKRKTGQPACTGANDQGTHRGEYRAACEANRKAGSKTAGSPRNTCLITTAARTIRLLRAPVDSCRPMLAPGA
eukprot:TRINITY_DN750_c0_g1_i6.p2 TRINITY_DN750_c0_g1~~TRINITY_DN750_c0_g1_i6.p2  ORF type:complete len:100 (-),score=1.35 TRINITY_DN750_c0_g1_i6:97-396(-)